MKRFCTIAICSALLISAATFTSSLLAQTAPAPAAKPAPASPPAMEKGNIGGVAISIAYSSPRVRGREGKIFTADGLIHSKEQHYPVWRAGANSATTLTTSGDLKFGDLLVPAGTYTLFVDISNPTDWKLIVSKATGEWGLSYDATKDLGRTSMHMSKPPSMVENLAYIIMNKGAGKGTLTLTWEDHTAMVNISKP